MILDSIRLQDYMAENSIRNEEFISYVGLKDKFEVYGGLFKTDKGLLLQLNKHVEINANKPSPKVASEEVSKFKLVDESIWDSFDKISWEEYCERWAISFTKVKIKGIDY